MGIFTGELAIVLLTLAAVLAILLILAPLGIWAALSAQAKAQRRIAAVFEEWLRAGNGASPEPLAIEPNPPPHLRQKEARILGIVLLSVILVVTIGYAAITLLLER